MRVSPLPSSDHVPPQRVLDFLASQAAAAGAAKEEPKKEEAAAPPCPPPVSPPSRSGSRRRRVMDYEGARLMAATSEAVVWLRRGRGLADKKASRIAAEGAIGPQHAVPASVSSR